MGLEIMVERPHGFRLGDVLARLAADGLPATIGMVDSALRAPNAPPPDEWRDVRLRTAAGMVTVTRRPGGVAVVVFGNAAPALQAAQRRVADAIRDAP